MQPTILYEVRVGGDKVRTTDNLTLAKAAYIEFKDRDIYNKAEVTLHEVCTSLLATSSNRSVCEFSVVDMANTLGSISNGWDLQDTTCITDLSEEECEHHLRVINYANEYVGNDDDL